jgi:phage terminase large subunit-like protein
MSESRFIDPSLWDQCLAPGLWEDTSGGLFIGIDASVKHDSTALVAVKYDRRSDDLILAAHRIWQPSPNEPMDFESTIEFFLCRLESYQRRIEKILCDPFQLHRTIMTLGQAGIPIEPFPQTLPNLTLATESLYSRLSNRRLCIAVQCVPSEAGAVTWRYPCGVVAAEKSGRTVSPNEPGEHIEVLSNLAHYREAR